MKAIITHIDFIYVTYRSILSFSESRQAGFTAKTESRLDCHGTSDSGRMGEVSQRQAQGRAPGRMLVALNAAGVDVVAEPRRAVFFNS
jgi:hypothetical protein